MMKTKHFIAGAVIFLSIAGFLESIQMGFGVLGGLCLVIGLHKYLSGE